MVYAAPTALHIDIKFQHFKEQGTEVEICVERREAGAENSK
jgi:hypothetical protein